MRTLIHISRLMRLLLLLYCSSFFVFGLVTHSTDTLSCLILNSLLISSVFWFALWFAHSGLIFVDDFVACCVFLCVVLASSVLFLSLIVVCR